MSVHHFKSLLFKSAQIQKEIEKEQSNRWPDWIRLLKLKKIRLSIKDKLERIVHKDFSEKGSRLRAIKIANRGGILIRR